NWLNYDAAHGGDIQHGNAGTGTAEITSPLDVAQTDLTYSGWDDTSTVVEPDQQGQSHKVIRDFGTGNEAGRLIDVKRGALASPTTVATYTHTMPGETASAKFGSASSTETDYQYDGLRELVLEKLQSTGMQRRYVYGDA